ncbi:PH protein [Geosmithia morbida]|uniref:PH protein n=1 Tax=Geosmithia morbida TaxID=1094350 RepID=A0A9P5D1P2_9HYPO|nr:PH protein [Geosmithia morbida]KAF4124143.1 PH protein [Geosmithia morbida]
MVDATTSTSRPSRRAIAVGLHEAALDSPTFRATAAHFAEQIEAVERWLNGYVGSTSRLLHEVLALEDTVNNFLARTIPSTADGVIDNDYTFLALKRVGDGAREFWMQLLGSTKRMEDAVVEPIRTFLQTEMRNFKEIRKVLEQTQRAYDSTLARYVSQSKTKEPSHLREDAFSVYETRKAYLQASMDYCQLAPQVRFVMDKLLVNVAGEHWKEMKRGRDTAINAVRWDQEMDRVRGWSKEMEAYEPVFRHELHAARRDLGENALTGCKPSREIDDYSTSTVAFLGSRGPMNMRPVDGGTVVSERQGWLFLRTVSGKPARHNWVRRWYYCQESVFGWLISGPQGVLQGDEIGVLLCNARAAPGEERRFCFEIKTKSQNLMLQAETQSELTEWLEVFEVAKKKAFEATMGRDSDPSGNTNPAFSIAPPSVPEFSARILDSQLGLVADEGSSQSSVDRAATLPLPTSEGPLSTRPSMDNNNSVPRRGITALGRDLAREEGESGREHAARIIQKLDLHRKATFGAGAEAALASSSGSASGVTSLITASQNTLPVAPASGAGAKPAVGPILASADHHSGTLAPLTLARPPAVTTLSRTAVLTMAAYGAAGIHSGYKKPSVSVMANYWGTNIWGASSTPAPDPVLPRLDEDDPVGVVVSIDDAKTPLNTSRQARQVRDALPPNYPPELRVQNSQFRLLFPSVPLEEKLVLVFRAAWSSTPATQSSTTDSMSGEGRVYVTPDNMYFYGEQMGLVTAYSLSLDMISEVTAIPGKESDKILLHLGQDTNDTGYNKITLKLFLDDIGLLHARLNTLIDELQAEVPMETEAVIAALLSVEREGAVGNASPLVDDWDISANAGIDDDEDDDDHGPTQRKRQIGFQSPGPSHLQAPGLGMSVSASKVHLPSHPVDFEPNDMKELATERHFEISAKSCFHVLFGDKSFVFPKLYFEHHAQQIAQGPWLPDEAGYLRREFEFKADGNNIFGRAKAVNVSDYQVIEMRKEHVTYVITHVRTAWHLPHSQNLKLVTKIVITFVGKSKCRLAVYNRVDWNKRPALSKNLVERQALRDGASDAETLAELATEQVRKLGARSRTLRAIQMYGGVGQQKQVVIFSPAASGGEGSRKPAIKPRTLTAMIWETVRSIGKSAVSSLIMWTFAGIKKLFEVVTAQRLLLAILAVSVLTNLAMTSAEASTWWSERQAANYMRRLGVGPNTIMSKAIYVSDLAEATGGVNINGSGSGNMFSSSSTSFPLDSPCFSSFQDLLDATDMDVAWDDDVWSPSSVLSPWSKATTRRIRRTRQRLGVYRHDLVVAIKVVNSIERQLLQSEWEDWLGNEILLCEDLGDVMRETESSSSASSVGSNKDTSTSTAATMSSMHSFFRSMPSDKREALDGWRAKHCGSCKTDYAHVVAQSKSGSQYYD